MQNSKVQIRNYKKNKVTSLYDEAISVNCLFILHVNVLFGKEKTSTLTPKLILKITNRFVKRVAAKFYTLTTKA